MNEYVFICHETLNMSMLILYKCVSVEELHLAYINITHFLYSGLVYTLMQLYYV